MRGSAKQPGAGWVEKRREEREEAWKREGTRRGARHVCKIPLVASVKLACLTCQAVCGPNPSLTGHEEA